jgi:hypothetical protein
MRITMMAAFAAITIASFAGAANATMWTYVPPAADGSCPAGSFLQSEHYGRHTHFVDSRCAFRPE